MIDECVKVQLEKKKKTEDGFTFSNILRQNLLVPNLYLSNIPSTPHNPELQFIVGDDCR